MGMTSALPRSTPEEQGIPSSAVLRFIEAAEADLRYMHSFVLLRHGVVVASGGWSPYAPDRRHMLFSLSKSFTATAIGFAVAEELLTVEDRMIDHFPDDLPAEISDNLRAMRVRHILSMNTGHDVDTLPVMAEKPGDEWNRAFFETPIVHEPGTHFLYNTGATYMLAALLHKLTGVRLLDYLTPRLLEPLGIESAEWEIAPTGIDIGGFGLSITTEAIARFGQLYLQKGKWNGQQLLSEAWVAEASSKHSHNGSDPLNDWNQGYGYQFWRSQHNTYRGDGAFGQFCFIMPDQDAVLAITSGLPDMQAVMNLVWKHLLPAMTSANPLPPNPAASDALTAKLSSLAYLPPTGSHSSPLAAQVSGKTYRLDANPMNLESICFDFEPSVCSVTISRLPGNYNFLDSMGRWSGPFTFPAGIGEWAESTTHLSGNTQGLAASVVWTADDTVVLTLRFYTMPPVFTFTCQFDGDTIIIDVDANFGFAEKIPPITGHS